MIEFSEFKKLFLEQVYWRNPIPQWKIENAFLEFKIGVEDVEKEAKQMFLDGNMDFESFKQTDLFVQAIKEAFYDYLTQEFTSKTLSHDGYCLKAHLINKACCFVHNKNILGVIRGIDEDNHRYLFVDFGENEDRKIDIDELIIAGISSNNT